MKLLALAYRLCSFNHLKLGEQLISVGKIICSFSLVYLLKKGTAGLLPDFYFNLMLSTIAFVTSRSSNGTAFGILLFSIHRMRSLAVDAVIGAIIPFSSYGGEMIQELLSNSFDWSIQEIVRKR